MKISVLALLTALTLSVKAVSYVDVRCTATFCKALVDEEGCATLPDVCSEESLLDNPDAGILLLSPTTCNCCDYCLKYLAAGASCVSGSVDQPLPTAICGPGLTCSLASPTDDNPTCGRIDSVCTRAQDLWDEMRLNGTLGSHISRPECDDKGDFVAAHCIPGLTCYCVAVNGERILGEIPLESETTSEEMLCPCSKNGWRASKVFSKNVVVSRCTDDGRFDPLQCVDNKCFCVNEDDGTLSGVEYSHVADLKEGVLPCFNPNVHAEGVYLKPCEQERFEVTQELDVLFDEGIVGIGPRAPSCDAAGEYSSMQDLGASKMCVDPTNQMLENFEVSKSLELAKNMDCKCARTRWLLRQLIATGHAVELPKCCANGNFAAWQCRRGLCYCVDNDGNQVGLEDADPGKLHCYIPGEVPCTGLTNNVSI